MISLAQKASVLTQKVQLANNTIFYFSRDFTGISNYVLQWSSSSNCDKKVTLIKFLKFFVLVPKIHLKGYKWQVQWNKGRLD